MMGFGFFGWFAESGGNVCGFYSSKNRFSYSSTQKSPLNKLLSKGPRINGKEGNINKPLNNKQKSPLNKLLTDGRGLSKATQGLLKNADV
jgi:hypothetical protein